MISEQEILTRPTNEYQQVGDARRQIESPGRRSFLGLLLSAGAASLGAFLSVPLVRVVLHPLLGAATPLSWTEIGRADEFASASSPVKKIITIEQRDGWRKIVTEKALYVCKDASGELCALSAVCPHLGCSVSWHNDTSHFKCPCHNGEFAADGERLAGPPLRGMDKLECKVEEGMVKVHYQSFRQAVPSKEIVA